MILEALMPRAATPAPDDDFWYDLSPIRPGGADVSPNGALQVTAVMACVRVLAETIAQLPLHLMATDGRMRRRAIEQGLYDVLHDEPNGWQTSFEFREMMQGHLALRGNAYAQIVPGPRGAVDQLIPLHPDRMQVFRLENKRIGYLYRDRQGVEYRLTQDEVFHLRFMSLDDCVGMSVIAHCRNAVELAQQLDEHGIRFYRNAARPSGAISMPEGFYFEDEAHAKRHAKSWRDAHTGEDLFTVAFLEGGAKWEQLGLSNEDAQWLESKRKSVTEIAMMFRIPPHMIGSAIEHGHTYANVEQSDIAFMKHTALPWARRWEGAIGRDLIVQPQNAAERLYAKFGMEGLLRADSKTRAMFYQIMLKNRVITRNEVRELEDMNPIEGGDEVEAVARPALPPPGNQDGDESAGDEPSAMEMAKLLVAGIEKQADAADAWAIKMQAVADVQEQYARDQAAFEIQAAELVQREAQLEEGKQRLRKEHEERDADLTARQAELSEIAEGHEQRAADIREEEAAITRAKEALARERTTLSECQHEIAAIGQRIIRAWIADGAERIARVEIEALESRVDKAAADREKFNVWAKEHWGGKHSVYVVRTLMPIFAASNSSPASTGEVLIVASICDSAIAQLTTGDPAEVLKQWKTGRADEITKLLIGELSDDE